MAFSGGSIPLPLAGLNEAGTTEAPFKFRHPGA